MTALMRAAFTPDHPADAQATWPAGLDLPRTRNEPAYVVCLHPRCPCSDATADALIEAVGTATDADVYVLFTVPETAADEWTQTELVERLRRVKGLRCVFDRGGRRSAILGAKASGQAFIYDAAGRLVFTGGLTPGRGERGDSLGLAAMRDMLAGHSHDGPTAQAPVFGCGLVCPAVAKARS